MSETVDWPLDSNVIRRGAESNTFGMVRRRADGSKKPHQGWDLLAAIGTPCHAIGDGKVVSVTNGGDYGLVVVHSLRFAGETYFAAFCHLSAASVKVGDTVKLGQVIGKTGDSGNAQGMKGADLHLHFELRTVATPGLGLAGRISPMKVLGPPPTAAPVKRRGAA